VFVVVVVDGFFFSFLEMPMRRRLRLAGFFQFFSRVLVLLLGRLRSGKREVVVVVKMLCMSRRMGLISRKASLAKKY
jgi:hypothetical protein